MVVRNVRFVYYSRKRNTVWCFFTCILYHAYYESYDQIGQCEVLYFTY